MKKSGKSFYEFMRTRHGTDSLYFFIFTVLIVVLVINFFADNFVLTLLSIALFVLMITRAFSINKKKRQRENITYQKISGKIKAPFLRMYNMHVLKNEYCFAKCKKCGAVVGAEIAKSGSKVTCTVCGTENVVKAASKRKS